jgi:hypothetical protein
MTLIPERSKLTSDRKKLHAEDYHSLYSTPNIYHSLYSTPNIVRMVKSSLRTNQKKKTPWPESVSELYRLSDCRWSARLVPTFSRPEPLLLLASSSSIVFMRLSGPTTSQKIW